MKLYHYTAAYKILPIKEQGLLPRPEETMSPNHAVVWLTTQPDLSLTVEAGNIIAAIFDIYEAPLADLHRQRATGDDFVAKPSRQWWYGSKGERLEMEIGGRECFLEFHFVAASEKRV
jgi:hypothetical protein